MIRILLFSILLIGLTSCGSDDEGNSGMLRYDGENFTSPQFPAGDHEAAARFPSFVTDEFQGQMLTGVQVVIYSIPQEIFLNIYDNGSAAGPDFPIERINITNNLTANGVNTLTFDNPLPITSEMWIGISWTSNRTEQVIGCDAGPANPNGDWIFSTTDQGGWTSFRDLSGGESVNWNIRGIVQ